MSAIVGIVIVSHSPKVAEGAGDMVRQMVGTEVPCAWTGGGSDVSNSSACWPSPAFQRRSNPMLENGFPESDRPQTEPA